MENTQTIIILVGILLAWSVYSSIRKHMQRNAVQAKLQENPVIIDVRTSSEYAGDHYDGAVNIPLQKLEQSLKRIGAKDKPVIVYCASGSRSRRAKAILKARGFSDVTNAGSISNLP